MNQDTKAILARREAFVKSVLSKNEAEEVKGGYTTSITPEPCLSPIICLSIIDIPQPCLSPATIVNEPAICLSPA